MHQSHTVTSPGCWGCFPFSLPQHRTELPVAENAVRALCAAALPALLQRQGPAVYLCTHTGQGMEKPVLPSCLMLLQCLWSSLEAAGQCSPLEQLCCTKETKSEIPPTSESSTQPTAPHNVPFSPLELKPLVRTWVSGLPKCHQTAKYCLMPAPAFHA